MNTELENLLQSNSLIWRGKRATQTHLSVIPSGFSELDRILPGGGWPLPALIEVLASVWGIGELSLLLPMMQGLNREGRWLIWIAPPFEPYAPALSGHGLDLRRVLVIDARHSEADLWWSMEKLLRHPATGLVMAWPRRIQAVVLRRLQLAAEEGGTIGVLFHREHTGSTPAALRVALKPSENGLEVRILKARGGWGGGGVKILFP
jgi:protein ImuA